MERWDVVMPVEHSSGDMRRSIMEVNCPANVVNLNNREDGLASKLFPLGRVQIVNYNILDFADLSVV